MAQKNPKQSAAHRRAQEVAKLVHEKLFSASKEITSQTGGKYDIKSLAQGACRGVYVGDYLFVSQNPNKDSRWAKMAREGAQITWVIHTPTNAWVARVVDGQVEALVS